MAQLRLRHYCNYCASLARAKLRGRHGGALQCGLTLCCTGEGSQDVLMVLGIDPLKNEANDVAMALGLDP